MTRPIIRPSATEPWMDDAPCASIDPDLFYPSATGYAQVIATRQAVAICKSCPVAAKCLDYAIRNVEVWGVWGATTEKERANMRRKAS